VPVFIDNQNRQVVTGYILGRCKEVAESTIRNVA